MGAPLPASLVARDVTVTIGRHTVLDRVDVNLAPGHRYGLIGPNGVGKSTLLRVLAGLIRPEHGRVERQPPSATVGLLDQEPERRPGETVRQLLSRRTGVAGATAELEAATADLAAGADGAADRYDAALQTWLALGGADHDSRAEETAASLGLVGERLDQPMTTLSGGEAAKASLASLLLAGHDVVLLDEPTNDLDLDGLDRLERWVLDQRRALMVVSHDRAFLERTVTDVIELDEHTRRASTFGGGWLAYQDEKATARRHAEEAYAGYAAQRETLTARAQRERQWSAAGVKRAKRAPDDNDKIIRFGRMEASENLAAKARRTEKALERLEEVEKPWEPWDLRFSIARTERSGDVVASLDGAVVERGGFRLGPVDLTVGWAERVGIVGPNGSGKSTLLAALLGRAGWPPGASTSARVWWWERWSRPAAASTAGAPCSMPSSPPRGSPSRRPAACWPSSAWGRRTWVVPPARCRQGSGRGPSWPCSWPRASTASCWTSRPTTWTFRPSSSWSKRWPASTAPCCWSATTAACSRQWR